MRRKKALLVHEIEKAQKALSAMDDAQALAMLKKMREQSAFPDWFWKEIVRSTALRLEETDTDWAKDMSPSEKKTILKKGPITRQWMKILDNWKKDATAWRAKHEKDLSLVVSRAVCNEIAEQAQHTRNVRPAGGIGQKASWYMKGGKEKRSFQRPQKSNLEPGASLFWARWEDKAPTDNVHKVRSDLFPVPRNEENQTIADGMTDAQGRTYKVTGDNLVTRTVPIGTPINPLAAPPTKVQWLVWFHEATVVQVDKDRVITFETGPIGIHHRPLEGTKARPQSGILDNPNIYVGFAPSTQEPAEIDKYLKNILPGR